jgi:hypothetical protein
MGKELGMVVLICHPSYNRKLKKGGLRSRPSWVKARHYYAGGMAQAIENLSASIKT